jgi:hypothetical protein
MVVAPPLASPAWNHLCLDQVPPLNLGPYGGNELIMPAIKMLQPVLGTFAEDLVQVLAGMLALLLIHRLVAKPFFNEKGHWFLLHAMANTAVVIAALPDIVEVARNPLRCVTMVPRSQWPNSIVLSVHFYHMVGGFALRAEDLAHHAIFVGILGTLGVGWKGYWGVIGSWPCFFLSGLPGGMTYYMLVAVKQGWMEPLTEKYYTSLINTYIRGPGALIHCWNLYLNFLYGQSLVPDPRFAAGITFLCFFLYYGNGQYYGAQAVADYAAKHAVQKGQVATGHYD